VTEPGGGAVEKNEELKLSRKKWP